MTCLYLVVEPSSCCILKQFRGLAADRRSDLWSHPLIFSKHNSFEIRVDSEASRYSRNLETSHVRDILASSRNFCRPINKICWPPISRVTLSMRLWPSLGVQAALPPDATVMSGSCTWRYTLWIRSPFRLIVHCTFLPKSLVPLKVCSIASSEKFVCE